MIGDVVFHTEESFQISFSTICINPEGGRGVLSNNPDIESIVTLKFNYLFFTAEERQRKIVV